MLARISLTTGALPLTGDDVSHLLLDQHALPETPRALQANSIEGDQGTYRFPAGDIADAFEDAARVFGAPAICGLAALSTVVGMLNPGLYSLFSTFTAVIAVDVGERLIYRAERFSEAVCQATLRVRSHGIDANVRAGARLPPAKQISAVQARALVAADAFAGRRPLVVGGSRGLGEVTAKLLAAGGATPVITYLAGKTDAESVATEIVTAGGACDVIRYDVRETPELQLGEIAGFTGLYYFASSHIFRTKRSPFEPDLIDEFVTIYVTAFYRLCAELAARNPGPLRVFYPSSVAVQSGSHLKALAEYACAKGAGEVACSQLMMFHPNLRILISRLPRIETDQTATMMPVPAAKAENMLLPLIHEVEAD